MEKEFEKNGMVDASVGQLFDEQKSATFDKHDFGLSGDDQGSLLGVESSQDSLISGIGAVDDAQDETLLGSVSDNMSFVELNNDVMSSEEIRIREAFFMNPKNQADILFENYLREQHVLLNRQQRRNVYQQFLKNAKKGRYNKIFKEQIYGISKEQADKNFGKLN